MYFVFIFFCVVVGRKYALPDVLEWILGEILFLERSKQNCKPLFPPNFSNSMCLYVSYDGLKNTQAAQAKQVWKENTYLVVGTIELTTILKNILKNENYSYKFSFAEIASSAMQEIHKIFTKVIEYFFFFYKFLDSWWGHLKTQIVYMLYSDAAENQYSDSWNNPIFYMMAA